MRPVLNLSSPSQGETDKGPEEDNHFVILIITLEEAPQKKGEAPRKKKSRLDPFCMPLRILFPCP